MAEEDKTRKSRKPAKKTESMIYSTPAKPQVSDVIGQRLKTYYDALTSQPVPDRFIELLEQLESKSSPKKGAE